MNIKTCFGISSCKGGVGKSTVACNIAITLANQGHKVGLLDADIYGPSVPTLLGIGDKEPVVKDGKFVPFEVFGLKAMSIGFLVNEDQAIVWRGPMLAKGLDGLINKTHWGDLDYLIVESVTWTKNAVKTIIESIFEIENINHLITLNKLLPFSDSSMILSIVIFVTSIALSFVFENSQCAT